MLMVTRMFYAITILSSIPVTIYMYVVLWGTLDIGIMRFQAINPEKVSFIMGLQTIALPAALYTFTQTLALLFRSPGNVWLYIADVMTSMGPICVVAAAGLLWIFGSYDASLYQKGALALWSLTILTDMTLVAIGARFLQRSWFGEGAGGGAGH